MTSQNLRPNQKGYRGQPNCEERTTDGRHCTIEGVYKFKIERAEIVLEAVLCRIHARVLRARGFELTPIALPSGNPLPASSRKNLIAAAIRRSKLTCLLLLVLAVPGCKKEDSDPPDAAEECAELSQDVEPAKRREFIYHCCVLFAWNEKACVVYATKATTAEAPVQP